jgi:hypothetical protein
MLNGFGHGSKPFPENNVGLMPLLYPHFATRLGQSHTPVFVQVQKPGGFGSLQSS